MTSLPRWAPTVRSTSILGPAAEAVAMRGRPVRPRRPTGHVSGNCHPQVTKKWLQKTSGSQVQPGTQVARREVGGVDRRARLELAAAAGEASRVDRIETDLLDQGHRGLLGPDVVTGDRDATPAGEPVAVGVVPQVLPADRVERLDHLGAEQVRGDQR